jgi:V-type H+-transporting ATPase proteolipid subunit
MTLADPQLLTGLGSALSIFLAGAGSAIASSEGAIYARRKKGVIAFVPIIISGVLSIYGIIIAIILVGKMASSSEQEMTEVSGYRHLSAGLAVGLASLVSGLGIARFLNHLNKEAVIAIEDDLECSKAQPLVQHGEEPNFVNLAFGLIFLEAIALYGLIVALFLIGK